MLLLIGLGNPGSQYKNTRHNVGFLVVDALAKRLGLTFTIKQSFEAELVEGEWEGQRILLCKPQTFMNASGRCVRKLMSKHSLHAENLIVIYDDADLAFADVRIKEKGSSAGHKGMQSILELFPPQTAVTRIRIGIGRPEHPDIPLDEFVLQNFDENEKGQLNELIEKSIDLLCTKISPTG